MALGSAAIRGQGATSLIRSAWPRSSKVPLWYDLAESAFPLRILYVRERPDRCWTQISCACCGRIEPLERCRVFVRRELNYLASLIEARHEATRKRSHHDSWEKISSLRTQG